DNAGRAHVWRRYRFQAAHQLPNVPAGHKCGRMHGHGFEGILHANSDLGERDLAIDYDHLDALWAPLHFELNYRCLNEIPGLENPTSELISSWLWARLKPQLPELSWITVYETGSSGANFNGRDYRIWKEMTLDSAVRLREAPAGHHLAALRGGDDPASPSAVVPPKLKPDQVQQVGVLRQHTPDPVWLGCRGGRRLATIAVEHVAHQVVRHHLPHHQAGRAGLKKTFIQHGDLHADIRSGPGQDLRLPLGKGCGEVGRKTILLDHPEAVGDRVSKKKNSTCTPGFCALELKVTTRRSLAKRGGLFVALERVQAGQGAVPASKDGLRGEQDKQQW
ncbi:MAG TPA: 6-carboxytetrahydropterin synthase, partial [Myxococcota bacterium]|nr:6-carboxytetrahydropterin synthase [Myxococcota bacterium]